MTDATAVSPHQPLGVGSIVSESFSILFRNLIPVAITSVVPILLGLIVSGLIIGFPAALGTSDPEFFGENAWILFILSVIFQLVFYAIVVASLVQLAYDAKLGRPFRYGNYAKAAIATIVPNVVIMVLVTILVGLAAIAFVIPGLWVYAVYSIVIPALVIERVGFGAMGRSQALTKGYRWPVFGTIFLIGICAAILNTAAVFVAGLLSGTLGGSVILVAAVIQAIFFSVAYGLSSIAVALIYARLRDIKEGVSVDTLVTVFE